MALLFILGGGLAALVGIGGFAIRILRDADSLLPDHDTLPPAAAPAPEDRLRRVQDLLEARRHWTAQPASLERELALNAIANSLRLLGEENALAPNA